MHSIEEICYYPDDIEKEHEIKKNSTEPLQIFEYPEHREIQSLIFYNEFLIIGVNGGISGYQWNEKIKKIEKKCWDIIIPTTMGVLEIPDVNSLYLNKENKNLYAGCGDNLINCIDLEYGKIMNSFNEHKDFIHCVSGFSNKIASASEDGTIKIWDERDKSSTYTIEPYKNTELIRSSFGKWQGTVSMNEDWIVCGGGPKLSLWYLRSMECTTIFSFPEKVHVSNFNEDTILAGGEYNKFYHYNFNGDIKAEIPLSSTCTYSVVLQHEPYKFMAIAGASNKIDICTNFTYRDIVLNL